MPAVLGRHASDDAGVYSVCPSFYREEFLQELLDNPPELRPVAWLRLDLFRICAPPAIWNATAGSTGYHWRRCYTREAIRTELGGITTWMMTGRKT
jgi:hypothetical protein